jgi:1-acyl-sn-glycerol-3-phosphate acyltransferase
LIARALKNIFESLIPPSGKRVFFSSLPFNRRLLFSYATKVVRKESRVENPERLAEIEELRRSGQRLTFICNHLSYADSHVIETLFMRAGFTDLAKHILHVAGQKTYQIYRRFMTRSLNTVRVYQPGAKLDKEFKRKMNNRALKWAAHLKRRGYCVLVFPEGTRSRRGRLNLHRANPRTTIYFRHSLVVPLGLMGSEKIMPVGRMLQKAATVRLRVGDAVDYDKQESEFRAANPDLNEMEVRSRLMLRFMQQINQLLDPEYRDQ